MPYPSNFGSPVRRWVATAVFSLVIFFVAYGCTEKLSSTDAEAERAAIAAERAEVKALSEEIRQQNLCGVIAYLVQRSNASLPSIEYYQEHPQELRAAQEANDETLRILDCPAIVPPPAIEAQPEQRFTPRDSHDHAPPKSSLQSGE